MGKRLTYEEMEKRLIELETKLNKQQSIQRKEVVFNNSELFEYIISSTTDGIAYLDKDYRYILVNSAYENFFSGSKDQFLGKTIAEYLGNEAFISTIKPHFDRCLSGEAICSQEWFENPYYGKRYIEMTFFPYKGATNNIEGVITNTRDITERKNAKDDLREMEEHQRKTINYSSAGYFFIDREGLFQEVNQTWLRLHKYNDASEVIGRHFAITQTAENKEEACKIVEEILCGKDIGTGEFSRKCKDSSVGFHSFTITPVFKHGKIIGLEGFLIDTTKQKLFAKTIKEREEQYSHIFENMMNGFALHQIIRDKTGRPVDYIFLDVNPAFEMLTGLKREDIIGQKVTTILPGIDLEQSNWIERYGGVASTGKHIRFEEYFAPLNQWFSVLAFRPQKEQFVTIFEDITTRKLAEEEVLRNKTLLMESNQIMDGMLQYTHMMAVFLDPDFNFISVNQAYAHTCGHPRAFFPGKNHFDLYPHAETQAIFKRVVTTGEPYVVEENLFEFPDQPKRGVTYWDWSLVPIKEATGKVTGLVFTLLEVTKRVLASKAMLLSEKKYRDMMESITDPVYISSADFRVEYMNPAMLNKREKSAIGQRCYRVLHNLDSQCSWCVYDEVLHGKSMETSIVSPKDNRHYRITNMPISNEDGTLSKMTILRDITDYLTAVDDRKKAQEMLQQSQKLESIGTLAGGIAHDFNNILSAMLGFTQLAKERVERGSPAEEDLSEVLKAGLRAKELVNQILVFARQSQEEVRPIQVDTMIAEVLRFIRSSTPVTIEIIQNIRSSSLILGNETQIHQIMMNLCTNATHAMEQKGGMLKIDVEDVEIDRKNVPAGSHLSSGEYIKIMVSDTGVGIPADKIGSIFEPFFTTKSVGEGTGMGLSVVHGIAKNCGGHISVESEIGKGSTFSIFLPISNKRQNQVIVNQEELPRGTEHILFVEDEAPLAKMGSRILEQLGYRVTTRTSSVEAIELFRSKPDHFDLIITDMTMPNISGDGLVEQVRKTRGDIPVILCTGYSKNISQEKATQLGINAFAYKPLVKADLASLIRKVIGDM